MKKIIIVIIILMQCALSANAWIFLKQAEDKAQGFTLLKLVDKQGNLRVCMEEFSANWRTEANVQLYHEVEQMVREGYNEWLKAVRTQIEKTNRRDEFKDVLALLPKEVNLVFVNEPTALKKITFRNQEVEMYPSCTDMYAYQNKVDLIIRFKDAPEFYNGECATTSNGKFRDAITFFPDGSTVGNYNRSMDDLVHEIGHTLGLSDMYKKSVSRGYNSAVYTMKKQNLEPEQFRVKSIMNVEGNCDIDFKEDRQRANIITCDDIDGVINLVDHYYPQKTAARRTTGWLSLCSNKKIAYAYSLPFSVSEEEQQLQRNFVRRGRIGTSPLAAQIKQVKQTAAQNADKLAAQQKNLEEQAQKQAQERVLKEFQQAQADSVQNKKAQVQIDKMNKSLWGKECPICHQPISADETPVDKAFRDKQTGKRGAIAVHQHCAASVKGLKGINERYIHRY